MATIAYLALDASYDPVFDPAQSLTNGQAVAQAVLTRLKLFMGEWWEDLNLGLPVLQKMLGQLGTQRGQRAISLLIQQNIRGAPYVKSVTDVVVSFTSGTYSFTAHFDTVFGPVTLTSPSPASSSSL